MELEWDEVKRRWTLETRGMDFADVEFFEFDTADTVADNRMGLWRSSPGLHWLSAWPSMRAVLDRTPPHHCPSHFIEESQ